MDGENAQMQDAKAAIAKKTPIGALRAIRQVYLDRSAGGEICGPARITEKFADKGYTRPRAQNMLKKSQRGETPDDVCEGGSKRNGQTP